MPHSWDVYDLSELFSLKETRGELSCMIYLEESDVLVAGNEDGSIRFFNPEARSSKRFECHSNTLCCLVSAVHRGRHYVISGGYDGVVVVWDVTARRTMQPTKLAEFRIHDVDAVDVEDEEVLCVAYLAKPTDPTMACYVTGGNDMRIRVRPGDGRLGAE